MRDERASLGAPIVDRTRVTDPRGNSGNKIERLTLADGRSVIAKTVSPEWDWITRATNDRGRIVTLWDSGAMTRLPASVDSTIVGVERDHSSWTIFMTDVSDVLLRDDVPHGADTARRLLRAAADVHHAMWDVEIPGLCSIEDRYRMSSLETSRREREAGNTDFADQIERGWAAFFDNIHSDVADVVRRLRDDPTPIADELRTCTQTLIHGDLRIGNAGFDGARTILIDWGERTGIAPPAVELAWFIGFDAKRLEITRDQIVELFRELYPDRFEERALHLGLIGGLVHHGVLIGLGFVAADDDAKRGAVKEEAAWWERTVARALDTWSPS